MLNKATAYIESLRQEHESDIEALNVVLEQQSEIYGNVCRLQLTDLVLINT